jgi:hypothetical protein
MENRFENRVRYQRGAARSESIAVYRKYAWISTARHEHGGCQKVSNVPFSAHM